MASRHVTAVLAAGLFLSLSVNFFLAGRMLGDAMHTEIATPAAAPDTPPERDSRREEWKKREEALHAALSDEDRAIMVAAKAEHDALFEAMREKLDAARSRVGEAMEAEPFDQAALDAAIAGEGAVKSELLNEMAAARRAVMERLSPEGRKTLREMMPMRRGKDKGRGHEMRGPKDPARKGEHGDFRRGEGPRPPHEAGHRPPHAPDDITGGPIPGHPAPETAPAPPQGADIQAEDMPNEGDAPDFAPMGEDIQPPDAPPVSAP